MVKKKTFLKFGLQILNRSWTLRRKYLGMPLKRFHSKTITWPEMFFDVGIGDLFIPISHSEKCSYMEDDHVAYTSAKRHKWIFPYTRTVVFHKSERSEFKTVDLSSFWEVFEEHSTKISVFSFWSSYMWNPHLFSFMLFYTEYKSSSLRVDQKEIKFHVFVCFLPLCWSKCRHPPSCIFIAFKR